MYGPDQPAIAEFIMPFFDPLKIGLVYFREVIHTDKYFQVKIITELGIGLVIDLFVFVFIIVPEGRNITEHCRSRWKGPGALAFKEMLVGEGAFRGKGIELILYMEQVVFWGYSLQNPLAGPGPTLL